MYVVAIRLLIRLSICHVHSAQSTQTNKSRLKLLHAREQHLSELFNVARNKLLELSQDEEKYEALLKHVIVQVRRAVPDMAKSSSL